MTTLLLIVIVAGLLFCLVNGWNDSADSVATVIATRVLTPAQAVLYAAVLNFAGALVSVKIAETISGAILGVGAAHRADAVRWSVGTHIVFAWLLTLPASAAIAGLLAWGLANTSLT